jgi:hypothetical protein
MIEVDMTLIVLGTLHHYNSDIKNKYASENYIYISKKILHMYEIHTGCTIEGKIIEINPAVDRDKQTEVAMPDLNIMSGLKVNLIYFEGEGEKDYLFISKILWSKLVGFAIFPEEYELKFELNTVACGWKKTKLFNKGTVIDK